MRLKAIRVSDALSVLPVAPVYAVTLRLQRAVGAIALRSSHRLIPAKRSSSEWQSNIAY